MDEKYLLPTVRYVERNPVAAKLCGKPEDWKWSGVRAHLSGIDDKPVRVKPMLDRMKVWSAYLAGTDGSDHEELIGLHTRTGKALGSKDFVRKLEVIAGKELVPERPGRKPIMVK